MTNGLNLNQLIVGFLAGVVALLIFHQGTILILALLKIVPNYPYSFRSVGPLGVPSLVNSAFWSGLWGIAFTFLLPRMPANWPTLVAGFVLGVVGPALVGWLIVAPLKGGAIMAGWDPGRLLIGALIHGMFGLGIALVLPMIAKSLGSRLKLA